MRLPHKAGDGETIQYVDVMSLYQYVCKYFKFPIDHPVIHVGDTCQNMQAALLKNGLMKCSILRPRHLYHPVLSFAKIKDCYCVSLPVVCCRTESRSARTKRLPKGL
jgi:hypothetical protein